MLERARKRSENVVARRRPLYSAGRRVAVFTAVDGALLDPRTFEAGPNARTIRELSGAGILVVPVTVMTLAEIEPIANELGLADVMIIEAGGGIARRVAGAWAVEACGPDAGTLLDVIGQIEERSGANLLVYSVLPEKDATRISGRTGDMLRGSVSRCFSEPFVIESGSVDDVSRAAASLGFSVRRGRRFFHLSRACDEGEAFSRVRRELACEVAIAIGSSPVDAGFLRRAEIPIVIPGANGPDRELLHDVPNARVASAPAPAGWSAGIEAAMAEVARLRRAMKMR